MAAPAHYALRAFCHVTGTERVFRLLVETALGVQKYAPPQKFFELRGNATHAPDERIPSGSSVAEVLDDPKCISQDTRAYHDGGLCYYGRPQQKWRRNETTSDPPAGMLFAVWVNDRGEIDDWDWTPENEDEPGTPLYVDGAIVWRKNREGT